jgi:RNase P/RNase MRP subunit p29
MSNDSNGYPDMSLPERNGNKKPKPSGAAKPEPPEMYGMSEEPTARWKSGDRVFAPWEPMFLYAGTIDRVVGDQAYIEFDDGDAGWVKVDEMRPLQIRRGQRVLSRRKMGLTFHPGEVIRVDGDKIVVHFEDSHDDEHTTIAAVRLITDGTNKGAEPVQVRSNRAFLKHLSEGTRVWAMWGDNALFAGTVTELDDDRAHVRFDDGDQGWISLQALIPLDIHVGMFVMSRWQMGPHYFPGQITSFEGKRVHVRYDDGDAEWTTTAALALPLQPPPGAAAPAANPSGSNLSTWAWAAVPVLIGAALLVGKYGCR